MPNQGWPGAELFMAYTSLTVNLHMLPALQLLTQWMDRYTVEGSGTGKAASGSAGDLCA